MYFHFEEIDEESALKQRVPPSFAADLGHVLFPELMRLDEQNEALLRAVDSRSPELADLVRNLNRKIDTLADHLRLGALGGLSAGLIVLFVGALASRFAPNTTLVSIGLVAIGALSGGLGALLGTRQWIRKPA